MAVLSTSEAIASRFCPYISELHEVFGQHGIPFGSAADLGSAADRLSAPGALADDVSSILRSTILREGGALPHTELFEILLVAIAGAEFDPDVQENQPGFRRLLTFAGSVARRPWNVPPGEEFPPSKEAAAVGEAAGESEQRTESAETAAEAVPQWQVVEESVEESAEPVPGSAVAAALATLPSPAMQAEEARPQHRAERGSAARRQNDQDGRADAEQALDADRDQDDEFETPLPLMPPPAPGSSAPLWFGAGFAVAMIFALTVWTRWVYAPPSYRVDAATRPVAPVSSPVRVLPAAAVALPATATASAAKARSRIRVAEEDVSNVSVRPVRPVVRRPQPVVVRHPRPVAVRAPAPIVRTPQPSQAGASRSEGGPTAPGPDKPAIEEAASMPPPPQPWGRTPVRSDDARSQYFQVSSGVMASHLLLSPDPGYPTLAKLTHIQGEVILQAVISSDGEVVATHVLSGHRLLRGAAVSAVKQWRYRPYVLDGRPVDVSTIITVDFRKHQ